MALSAAQRRRIPAKDFVFPETRKYPINTRKRAQEALSLAALHGSQLGGTKGRALIDKVYSKVLRRYPSLSESDSKTMRAYLRRKGKKTMARNNPVTMSDADIVKHINTHLAKYRRYLSKISRRSLGTKRVQNGLEAVAMAARSLQREAEEMLDYDVIYEKKTRKNPTGGLNEYHVIRRHLKSLGLSTKGKLPTLQRRLDAAMARGEYPIIDEREFMSRGKKVKAVSRLVSRRNPGRKRKMAPAVKSRAALVKKAFALREKTGSRMKPTTIMKDPAAAIRRLSK